MQLKRLFSAGALIACALLSGPAHSATGPIIDWDPAFFWQVGATPSNAPALGELKMLGTISQFGPPFAFLNANMPATEYTFYGYGLISGGTTTVGPPATELYTTPYTGGTIEIYEDTTPDAVFNPPSAATIANFTNGTLILQGTFSAFTTETNNFTTFQVGDAEGTITWTGGSLFSLVSPSGVPCPGLFVGGMTWRPTVVPAGYLFRHDGKIDLNCPVPANASTWGRIKSLYR